MADNSIEIIRPIPRPATSKSGDPITYYQEDGQEMRRYDKSGVIQRWSSKANRWVFAPGTARAIIDSERATEIVTSRWDMVRDAAVQGLIAGTGKSTEPEAIQELTRVATVYAIGGGKQGSQYFERAVELAQLRRPARASDAAPAPGTVRLTATLDVAQVRELMRKRYEGE